MIPLRLVCATALLWSVGAVAAPPEPPTRATVSERADAVLAQPVPTAVAGELRVGVASEERRLRRRFAETLAAQPGWRNQAVVVAKGRYRVEAAATALGRPELLSCRNGICRLSAPLVVDAGATLIVDGVTLALEQSTGTAIVAFGDLFVSSAVIEGRAGDAAATTDGGGFRPFIVAYDAAKVLIRDSRLAHLGHDGNDSAGLTLTVTRREDPPARPGLKLVESRLENLYDGVFARGADGIEIIRTTIRQAARNGIALRDGTRNLLLADNQIEAATGHGILLSRAIAQGSIVGNRGQDNGGSGLLIDKGGVDLTVAGNHFARNQRDALVVYESAEIAILRNAIAGNGRSGVRVRSSEAIQVSQNAIADNARAGVDLHDWSTASRPPNEEEEALLRPTRITVSGNRFAGNARGDCAIAGEVTLVPAADGRSDC